MGALNLVGIFFVSVAVVIAVVGQMTTIADYIGLKRLRYDPPLIAFLGVSAFIFLASSVATLAVATNLTFATQFADANQFAEAAIYYAEGIYVITLIWLLIHLIRQKSKTARWVQFICLYLIGAIAAALLLPFSNLPPGLPTVLDAFILSLIPILSSWTR